MKIPTQYRRQLRKMLATLAVIILMSLVHQVNLYATGDPMSISGWLRPLSSKIIDEVLVEAAQILINKYTICK